MLSGDGGPLPATEAAYMDQSMRRAWASAAFRKVQQPSCWIEMVFQVVACTPSHGKPRMSAVARIRAPQRARARLSDHVRRICQV